MKETIDAYVTELRLLTLQSILPVFSQILEKLFYCRLSNFLDKYSILNQHQYGFRQGYSTYMAILELGNHIFQGFERKNLL